MFQIVFGRVALSKAGRYLVLVVARGETKRSEVCGQWTSSPEFQPVELGEEAEGFELRMCETTSDRKLRVVGCVVIRKEMLDGDGLFEGEVNLEQDVEGERICVGICNVVVRRKVEFEEVKENGPERVGEENQDELMLEDQEKDQPDEEVRLEFHCGFNFYLGSAFHLEVQWGRSEFRTRSVRDKINPVWCESACLSGLVAKKLEVKVCDNKSNVLESIRFEVGVMRVMFPYHLRIRFKEEFMGAIPEVFITLVRQSFPIFSITQIPIRFSLRNLGQSARPLLYLMVSLRKQLSFPKFFELDRGKLSSLQQINKYISSASSGEQDRIDLVGLSNPEATNNFSILKSYLNRKLYLHLFFLGDARSSFMQQNWGSCKMVESRCDFKIILRKVYYNGETFTLKKYFEIFNPLFDVEKYDGQKSAKQQWKLLSNNYLLRNKLVHSSITRVGQLKQAIESKGKELVDLKKVLAAVREVNGALTAKQRLMGAIKGRKIRYNPKEINTSDLITALISRQSELQERKRINAEMSLRMGCLAQVEEDRQDLQQQVLENAKELLVQQQRVKRMQLMERALGRQREIIGELEKVFERGQIDRRVNEALREQEEKLRRIREQKQAGLAKVYDTIRGQGREGGSMVARIKRAEEMLVGLNEQYARLVGF